jgi:DNA repair photolyase
VKDPYIIGITERGDGGLEWEQVRAAMDRLDAAIIVTKAPSKLLEWEGIEKEMVIVHCTITGWGGSKLEPNVRTWIEEIVAYKELLGKLGGERCVLRVDPVIPYEPFLGVARSMLSHLKPGSRARISFLDAYGFVRERFDKAGVSLGIPWERGVHAPLSARRAAFDNLQRWRGQLEVCGEDGFNTCYGCISARDLFALGLDTENALLPTRRQRKECRCIVGKTELLDKKHPCPHECLYCYWRDPGKG